MVFKAVSEKIDFDAAVWKHCFCRICKETNMPPETMVSLVNSQLASGGKYTVTNQE